jgi:cell division septation protein DedD
VLFVAWLVTCGLVYALGFYVGKGTQERRLGLEERVVRLPVTSRPPPAGQRAAPERELTFYDALLAGEQDAGRRAHPAPAARPDVAGAPGPRAPSPAEASPPPAAAPAATPPPSPAREAPPPTAPVAAAARPTPPAAVTSPPAESGAGTPRGSAWTVLANPTRSREEAEGLVSQLRGRGYDASLVRVLRDGDTWYRVRVGRFANAAQATEVMQRLREREHVPHAFVASE